MVRVKRGTVARERRKKTKSLVRGSKGSNSYLFRMAQQQAMKALRYAYISRRQKKRRSRSLSLVRLNAIVRLRGINYSSFIYYLRKKTCLLNRKTLAHLAFYDPIAFQTLLNSLFFIMFVRYTKTTNCIVFATHKNTYLKKGSIQHSLPYSISYKNTNILRKYIGITGKILPRRLTGLTAKKHRSIAKAIRQSRRVGIFPSVCTRK
jgi:large subunit ribosomal protein L20